MDRQRLNPAERLLSRIFTLLNRNCARYILRSRRLRSLIVRFQERGGNIRDITVSIQAEAPTVQPPDSSRPIGRQFTRRDRAWLAGLGIATGRRMEAKTREQ